MIAYTLGRRGRFDIISRMGGEAAPCTYAFESRESALAYAQANRDETSGMGIYAMELPATFEESTTDDYLIAAEARHAWHERKVVRLASCGVCFPREVVLTCRLTTVAAPLVAPAQAEAVVAHG